MFVCLAAFRVSYGWRLCLYKNYELCVILSVFGCSCNTLLVLFSVIESIFNLLFDLNLRVSNSFLEVGKRKPRILVAATIGAVIRCELSRESDNLLLQPRPQNENAQFVRESGLHQGKSLNRISR